MVPSSRQIWSKNWGLLHPTVAIPHPLPTFLSRHPHPSTQPPWWNVLTVTCPPFFSPSSALSRFQEMLKKAAMSFLTMTICLLLFWCVIIVEIWCRCCLLAMKIQELTMYIESLASLHQNLCFRTQILYIYRPAWTALLSIRKLPLTRQDLFHKLNRT